MKAITLYQPWATLVAIGAKRIETRSWFTSYRGPLAIHVSKKIPGDAKVLCGWTKEPFASALKGELWNSETIQMNLFGQEMTGTRYQEFREKLYLGCVIAVCDLIDCVQMLPNSFFWEALERKYLSDQERAFGSYDRGRYGWVLANVRRLEIPIPARGALGLWEWEEQVSPTRHS